jgi:AcrR family transcriptional regulator
MTDSVATRDRLLAAAVQLIGEVGWHSVSTRLVADRAGVNQALVHYHFQSVAGLLTAATTATAETMLSRAAEELTAQPSVDAGIDRLLDEISRYTADDPEALLLLEAFLASTRLPALRQHLAQSMRGFRASVAAWLRRIGAGSSAEADAAAGALSAALDGIVLHHLLDPEADVRTHAAPLRRMLTSTGTGTPA